MRTVSTRICATLRRVRRGARHGERPAAGTAAMSSDSKRPGMSAAVVQRSTSASALRASFVGSSRPSRFHSRKVSRSAGPYSSPETRKEMPTPMVPQLDFVQKLTPLLGFKNISLPNTEADDLMGCYALAACKQRGMEVVLATNDKDLYQLVGPCVKVYTTAKADLASPKDAFALLGEDQV